MSIQIRIRSFPHSYFDSVPLYINISHGLKHYSTCKVDLINTFKTLSKPHFFKAITLCLVFSHILSLSDKGWGFDKKSGARPVSMEEKCERHHFFLQKFPSLSFLITILCETDKTCKRPHILMGRTLHL